MVRNLHSAGIEVILDVVYNHTAEGNHWGRPCVSRVLKTKLLPLWFRITFATTWTTRHRNTLNVMHARSLQLIMDSLRYWVTEMHVDGFRFDLAATLARELHAVSKLSGIF